MTRGPDHREQNSCGVETLRGDRDSLKENDIFLYILLLITRTHTHTHTCIWVTWLIMSLQGNRTLVGVVGVDIPITELIREIPIAQVWNQVFS